MDLHHLAQASSLLDNDSASESWQAVPAAALGQQLAQLVETFYVDLDHVREARGFDPVRALRRARRPEQLLRAFERLGDRHSQLHIPAHQPTDHRPAAFSAARQSGLLDLGLRLEASGEGGGWRAWVTGRETSLEHQIPLGSEATHWNGVPIERASRALGRRLRGGHRAARRELGLRSLSQRMMGSNRLPDEDWVWLTLQDAGTTTHTRLDWCSDHLASATDHADTWREPLESCITSDGFRCGRLRGPSPAPALYLRLFSVPDWEDLASLRYWLREQHRSATDRPSLVLDLRSNPGGQLATAERLALLLGADTQLRSNSKRLVRLRDGAHTHLQPRPGADDQCRVDRAARPDVAPLLHTQILVIVDALTYSAAEVLAVLLRAHCGAQVAGVHSHTGGGIANAWCFDALRRQHQDAVDPLPKHVDLQLAVRTVELLTRHGWRAPRDVEIDMRLEITRDDLFFGNRDLLRDAAQILHHLDTVSRLQLETLGKSGARAPSRSHYATQQCSRLLASECWVA